MAGGNGAVLYTPLGLLAELTHRCPLGCPYCSNPIALDPRSSELDTQTWARVFTEAAALGVLQVHLSGGEPGARRDLVEITAAARSAGLYTNLITSAVGITIETLRKLGETGLDHVQISIQDSEPASADHIAGYKGAFTRKRALRRRSRGAENPADGQRRHAPRQYRPGREHGGAGALARRQPGRNRARAILRLGAEEPRRADADGRAGQARRGGGRGHCGRAIMARSSSMPSCPIITPGCQSPASAVGAGARST